MNNDGFASGFAFGYDPTRRSVNFIKIEYLKSKIRIPKSKICFLKFLFRSDWTLAASGPADTRNLTP